MKFQITHQTQYTFSKPVFLEPHTLRFYPSNLQLSSVLNFNLQVYPQPSGILFQTDCENNPIHFCWFEGTTSQLKVTATILVENKNFSPFNFIFYPARFSSSPFSYSEEQQQLLQMYLVYEDLSKSLTDYGKKLLQENNFETIPFLLSLTKQINHDFTIEARETGPPMSANETFQMKRGSCRDLAWMQIQLLRQMGMAAKFCSGYYYIDMEQPEYELHAWVEVYLPGAGWFGLDPTAGLVTGENYVKVAACAHFSNTNPLQGNFRGDALASLHTQLKIEVIL